MTTPKNEGCVLRRGTKLNYGKALGMMDASTAGRTIREHLLADRNEESVYLAEIARQRGTTCADMHRAL